MKKIYTTAMLSAAVLTGAAFGPSFAGAQATDDSAATDSTATEATETTEHGREGRGGKGGKGAAVAELLGLTQDEVRAAMDEGQTVSDLAAAQGVDIQTVIDAIIADMTDHIQEHVDAGDLTAEEASEKLADVEERVTDRVTTTREERKATRQAEMADSLGVTVEVLEAAKEAGTVRDLAEAAGVELPERSERGGRGGQRGGRAGQSQDADAASEQGDA